jgi:hypothetical protein
MCKVKSIQMTTTSVQAILAGRKTQTRRVITQLYRLQKHGGPLLSGHPVGDSNDPDNPIGFMTGCGIERPTYSSGDILCVRETWCKIKETIITDDFSVNYFLYKATDEKPTQLHWRSPRFMPREAARIFLRVAGVRAERVQGITAEDCIAEGVDLEWTEEMPKPGYMSLAYSEKVVKPAFIKAYHELWDDLNAKRGYGWDKNPWVWAYTFERVERPQGWPTVA